MTLYEVTNNGRRKAEIIKYGGTVGLQLTDEIEIFPTDYISILSNPMAYYKVVEIASDEVVIACEVTEPGIMAWKSEEVSQEQVEVNIQNIDAVSNSALDMYRHKTGNPW